MKDGEHMTNPIGRVERFLTGALLAVGLAGALAATYVVFLCSGNGPRSAWRQVRELVAKSQAAVDAAWRKGEWLEANGKAPWQRKGDA